MASSRRKRPARARRAKAVLILVAYPGTEVAEEAARRLVQAGVLACATVTEGESFYIWEGREHAEAGAVLRGKTTAARARDAQRLIQETHPDKLPEILVLEIADGHPGYLAWVAAQVAPK